MKLLKPISQDATRAFQEKYGKSSPAKQRALQIFHPRKFSAMYEDIVARKQFCEDVVQQVGHGIIVFDRNWKISTANSELEGIFGMPGSASIGKSVFQFLSGFLDSEQMGILSSQMGSSLDGNKRQYELSIAVGGIQKTILITATPRKDKAGNVIGSIGVIEDITERKKAHEQLEMFFRGVHDSPVAITITDLSGNTIYANGSYESMAGSPLSELTGKIPPTLLHSPIQQMWSAEDTAGMASGKKGWKGQLTPTGGSCAGSVLQTTVSPVIGSDGKAFGFLIIHEDVTLLAKLSSDLAVKNKSLSELSKNLSDLLNLISHDAKNSLNAAKGYSQILSTELIGKVDAEYAEIITGLEQAISHSIQILEDGRASAAANGKPEPVLFKAFDKVQELLSPFVMSAKTKNIELQFEVPPAIMGEDTYSDRAAFESVFRNLLGNAIKFTKNGGDGFVRISAEDCGEFLKFYISDNGVGIPEGRKKDVFKSSGIKFSTTGTSGEPGTGLGLYACRQNVLAWGGDIGFQSDGNGTTFFFTVPKAPPGSKAQAGE